MMKCTSTVMMAPRLVLNQNSIYGIILYVQLYVQSVDLTNKKRLINNNNTIQQHHHHISHISRNKKYNKMVER
jgi:hypothetical protein